MNLIVVYVQLLEEGTPTIRPTEAELIQEGICRLLPTPDYDPEDEIWEFVPGSVVHYTSSKSDTGEDILLVIK